MATEEAYHAHIWCGGYPKEIQKYIFIKELIFSYNVYPSISQRTSCLTTGVQNELL